MLDQTESNKKTLVSAADIAGGDVENTVKCYSKFAKVYHDMHLKTWKGPSTLATAAAEAIEDQPDNATVLDVGAGTGLLAMALRMKGSTTIDAMDVSKEMLDEAQNKTGDALYRDLYIELMGKDFFVEPESYDLIAAAGVIGTHVYAEEVSRLLSLVKPGGTFMYTIRAETDDSEFSSSFASLEEEGKSETGNWEKVESKEVGPLNVEVPTVNHRITILKRKN